MIDLLRFFIKIQLIISKSPHFYIEKEYAYLTFSESYKKKSTHRTKYNWITYKLCHLHTGRCFYVNLFGRYYFRHRDRCKLIYGQSILLENGVTKVTIWSFDLSSSYIIAKDSWITIHKALDYFTNARKDELGVVRRETS